MKSWALRENARRVLSKEVGYIQKPHGDRLRVALCFPNTYFVGMSNLGFQTMYRLFNERDDVVCERVFLPPKQELAAQLASGTRAVTLESQSPISDFDVFAFSVSFEWDYTNVVTMLRLAGMPAYAEERSPGHPLVLIGGAVTFVNPEPLALFADVIAAGEGEVLVPELVSAISAATSRQDLLRQLSTSRGFYVPSAYDVAYGADNTIASVTARPDTGAPATVRKAAVKSTDRLDPPHTSIFTPDTEFGSRFLIEVVRGCANLCRFCWAGYNYLPVRAFPADRILSLAEAARAHSAKAGLVSIALCDHPEIERILTSLSGMGYSISPASLRLDDLTETIVRLLRESGERTLTIAPETGSDRLRRVINKTVTNEEILDRADLIFASGIENLKLYLHDRPPDRDRRRSRKHPRPHAPDARPHAQTRPLTRPHRPHHRLRQSADPEARDRVPVAAHGAHRGHGPQGQTPAPPDGRHRQRLLHDQVRTALVLPGAALARRPPRRARRSSPPNATAETGAPPSKKHRSTPTTSSSATAAKTPFSPGTSSTAA